ncbi:MAG: hypothetical protein JW716_05655 [Candidatus Aenigmarchaeota archaeon]|nr:hypothetical protein [Candidatus Aenigmarchaeota archaeon]
MKKYGIFGLTFIIFTALSLISSSVHAAECSGFGSIPHTSQTISVKPGSNNYVGISFFNCKEENLIVEISIDNLPVGWWFTIESDQLQGSDKIYLESQTPTKNPTSGGSWFILSDGASYIKTVPVSLKIGAPTDVWGGVYTLKVTALASPVSSQGNKGFSIIPKFGREFNFYIQIPAPYKPQETTTSEAELKTEENIIQDLKSKIDEKKKTMEDEKSGDDFSGYLDEEPPVIRGTDTKATGDGLTGLSIGGLSSSSIIILVIILLVIAALLFYLRS